MRVLVTGANGFLGRFVLQELLRTDHEITATSRQREDSMASKLGRVHYVCCDLNQDREDYFEHLDRPDAVIHLAWEGLPHYRELYHIERNLMSNYWFLRRMVDSGVSDVTVVGTCLEYGLVNGCLGENLIPQPIVPYAIAKDTLRRFLQELSKIRDYALKWIRLFYVYGGGENPSSLLGQLRRAMLNRETLFNMSGGEQLRDYLPVEVAARYIVRVACQPNYVGVVNCCSGQPISVRNLVEREMKAQGLSMQLQLGSLPYCDYEPMAFWGDVTRLKQIIGEEFAK